MNPQPADEKISYKGIGATANDLPEGVQAQDNKGSELRGFCDLKTVVSPFALLLPQKPSSTTFPRSPEVYNLPRMSSSWHTEHGRPLPPPLESRRALIERFQKGCHDTVVAILDAFSVGLNIPDQPNGRKGETYLSDVAHSWEKPNWTFTRWLHYVGLNHLLCRNGQQSYEITMLSPQPPLPQDADTTADMQKTGQFRNPGASTIDLADLHIVFPTSLV
jgi:hypothetical protein